MLLPRIVFAGVSSGVGKTTITTAFIANLRTRGIRVQPFKVGPDYIDPSHLALAASQPCYSLDSWMMPPGRMLDVFCTNAASTDIAVIEGVKVHHRAPTHKKMKHTLSREKGISHGGRRNHSGA